MSLLGKTALEVVVAVEGITTSAGAGAGTSFIDAELAGAGANSFSPMLAVLYPGQPRQVDSIEITAFDNATGEVTLAGAYKGVAAAIPAGVPYKIVTFRFVTAEVDAIKAVTDLLPDAGALTALLADIDPLVMGRTQIFEKPITSPANAGDVVVATMTDHPCQIESIVLHADAVQTGDLTSAGIFGGAAKVITFIAAADALQADLDAIDKQVWWEGKVRLAATKTIVISLVGTGVTPVDLTISITYRACVSGGYLA